MAVETYERLAAQRPKDYEARMLLGKACTGAGRYRDSLEAFLGASRLKPRSPVPLLAMAQVSRLLNDSDRALQVYARVLVVEPKNPEARFGRAQIFSERGRLDLAANDARMAAKVLAQNGKIRALLAAVYRAQGQDEAAEGQLALARQYTADGEELYEAFLQRIPEGAASAPLPEGATPP